MISFYLYSPNRSLENYASIVARAVLAVFLAAQLLSPMGFGHPLMRNPVSNICISEWNRKHLWRLLQCFVVETLTDFYQPDWQTWQTNKQKHWKARPPCWFQVLFIFWKCGEDLTSGSRKNRNDGKRIGSSVNLLMPLFTKIVWSAQNVQIPELHSLSKKWKWS